MITIKPIGRDDLTDLATLLAELSGKPTSKESMLNNFEWMEKNGDYYVLGAKLDQRLAGSIMGIVCRDLVGECQPFLVVENVIVSNQFRGQGIGKRLMLEMEKIGIKRDCHYIMFVSGAQRRDAHQFYESLGYKLDVVQGFKKYLD
jgi:ribosomal protein S18 acetylase RimI-like enzyme